MKVMSEEYLLKKEMEIEEARLARLREEEAALKNKEKDLNNNLSAEEKLLKEVEKEISQE